jgi:FKBP-type peptidyl-prolyl cis-trans isomerase SlyD
MPTQVVSFKCVLKTKLGELISSSFTREVWSDGVDPHSDRLPALANGLKDLRQGEKRLIAVPAAEAYGLYDRKLLVEVSRKKLVTPQSRIEIGQEVIVETKSGALRPFRIIGFTGTRVTLDGNHPLAGQDLVFDIEATEVREATSEELSFEKVREQDYRQQMILAHPKWGPLH